MKPEWFEKIEELVNDPFYQHLPIDVRAMKALLSHITKLREALEKADKFISNGVELGFIKLPDEPDPALRTPEIIQQALLHNPMKGVE